MNKLFRRKMMVSVILLVTMISLLSPTIATAESTQLDIVNVMSTVGEVAAPSIETEAELIPSVTPNVMPEATPEPTPAITPEVTVELEPTPEVTPELTLEVMAAMLPDGWQGSGNERQYIEDGIPVSGWKDIAGQKYYFDSDNSDYMAVGWKTITTGSVVQDFYFESDLEKSTFGAMYLGWQKIDNKTFFFEKAGADGTKGKLQVGWQKHNSKDYFYFTESGDFGVKGAMVTGWKTMGANTYYFKKTGTDGIKGRLLHEGWSKSKGKIYYFKKSGKLGEDLGKVLEGWQTIAKEHFYFEVGGKLATRGSMVTGWRNIGKNTYYLKKTGAYGTKGRLLHEGFSKSKGKTYYFGTTGTLGGNLGKMQTDWLSHNGQLYYFKKTGAVAIKGSMCVGENRKDRANFTFNKNGVLLNTNMNITAEAQGNYGGLAFGNTNIAANGCGVVSMAVALRFMTGKNISVREMRDIAEPYFDPQSAYYNGKVYEEFFRVAANAYGKKAKITTSSNEALVALKKGHPVLSFQRSPLFTNSGHWIVLRATTQNNQVRISDPWRGFTRGYNSRVFNFNPEITSGGVKFVILSK